MDDLLTHPVRFDRCADTVTQGGLYLLTSVAASIKEANMKVSHAFSCSHYFSFAYLELKV